MRLILCVDDSFGLSFGGKRQSRDRELTKEILTIAKGSVLWTDAYSGKLLLADPAGFSEETVTTDEIRVDEACLAKAGPGEYCFVEVQDVSAAANEAEQLILYHWNRSYPSTVKFVMPDGFTLRKSRDFAGYSHDKITEEVYVREKTTEDF